MEVVLYQALVVASIWGASRVSSSAAFWVALAWTVETLALLFFPPLIVIQLAVVWVTYFSVTPGAKNSSTDSELNTQLKDHPASTRARLQAAPAKYVEFVSGRDHEELLRSALRNCRQRLCILSGWISSSVVNAAFLKELETALNRGASVFIAWGYEDSAGKHSKSRQGQEAFQSLKRLQMTAERKGYSGKLKLAELPTHEKILVKDNDVVVCGSNNWLSNSRFHNSERSVVVRAPDFASTEGSRVAELVTAHAV